MLLSTFHTVTQFIYMIRRRKKNALVSTLALVIISLQSCIILKTTASFILQVRIVYPFRHQCRWLNSIWFICGSIWTLCIAVCTVNVLSVGRFFSQDVFCTYWFQGAEELVTLKIYVCIIEIICVCCSLLTLLTKAALSKTMHVNYSVKIVFPLALELVVEATFRLVGISWFIIEIESPLKRRDLCMVLICFILPSKTILSLSARYTKKIMCM